MPDINNVIAESSAVDNSVANYTPQDNSDKAEMIARLQYQQKKGRKNNPESIIRDVTNDYLKDLVVSLPDLADEETDEAVRIHDEWMGACEYEFECENAMRKGNKQQSLRIPTALPGYVASQIVLSTGDVRIMRTGKAGYKIILKKYYRNASTHWQWKWAGWWEVVDEDDETSLLFRAFRLLCPSYDMKDKKTFLDKLRDARNCIATQDSNLVYFRNGVWNFTDRSFTEYDDPQFNTKYPTQISLGKLPVYHPLGKGPKGKVAVLNPDGTIQEPVLRDRGDHTPWHPSQLWTDPFEMDTEVGQASSLLIQQAGHFLIRKRNSDFGFYHFWINANGMGRNMKSTITDALMRLLRKPEIEEGDEDLGDMSNRIINASVEELGDPYVLAQNILTAYAIVGEESNGTVTYVDRASVAKMLARRQEMTYRNIYEKPFSFKYDGFLCQHSNKAPIFNEKNDSIISHVIVIPFEHTFTYPRAYIKQDYVNRDIVASYYAYMFTVAMEPLNEYDEHAREVLEPYKREMLKASMTTFQFCDEALSGMPLTVIPLDLLYDLYQRWCDLRGVTGRAVVNFRTFQEDMEQYGLNNDHQVRFERKSQRVDQNELDRPSIALHEFGSSLKYGVTQFRSTNPAEINMSYNFKKEAFEAPNGARKQFTRGCLIRTVPYDSMNYDNKEEREALESVLG